MFSSMSSTFPLGYPGLGWHLTSSTMPKTPGRSASLRLPMCTFARPSIFVLLQVWREGICGCMAKVSPPEIHSMTPALRHAKDPLKNLEPASMVRHRFSLYVFFTIRSPSSGTGLSKPPLLCWFAQCANHGVCVCEGFVDQEGLRRWPRLSSSYI